MVKLPFLAFAVLFIKLCCCGSSRQIEEKDSQTVLTHSIHQSSCRLNLCYVLDGSSSTNLTVFQEQLTFSLDILAEILLTPIGLAATQYGSQNFPISPYTIDENGFVAVFRKVKPRRGLTATSDGIIYCEQQLRSKRNNANVIIVMSDGSYNRGVNPGKIVELIQQETGNYLFLAVKVGRPGINRLLKDIGGKNVFEINREDTIKAISVVEQYEKQVCKN